MRFSVLWVALLSVACGGDHDHDQDHHTVDAGAGVDAGGGLAPMCTSPAWSRWVQTGSFGLPVESSPIPQDLTLYTWLIEFETPTGTRWRGLWSSRPCPITSMAPTITTPRVAAEGVGRFTLSEWTCSWRVFGGWNCA